ncbi:unnamed protein product [marine sediment metagenome]|uniref:Uncharacterized protein n=1 Tax=marine sediment metagenome TaxID=412755 RepID=X1TCA4_9ZZZZ
MTKRPYEFADLSLLKRIEKRLKSREEKEETKIFKTCLKCGKRKSLSYFTADKRSSDGTTGECRACRSERSLTYYYQNREEILIKIKEYQDKKDRSKYFENYKIDHKEHLQEIAHKWYKKNRKGIKERNLRRKTKLKNEGS